MFNYWFDVVELLCQFLETWTFSFSLLLWMSEDKAMLPTECPDLGKRALKENINVLMVTFLKVDAADRNGCPNSKATC